MSLVIRAGKVLDPEGGAGSADPPTGRRAQAKAGAWMRRWAGIGGSSPVAPLASRADEAACDMPLPTMFLTTKRKLVTPPGRNPVDLFIPGSKLKSADKSQTDIKCFLIKCTENSVQFLPQTPNLSWNIRKHKKDRGTLPHRLRRKRQKTERSVCSRIFSCYKGYYADNWKDLKKICRVGSNTVSMTIVWFCGYVKECCYF